MEKTRVLLLGLDGATLNLLTRFCKEGIMPHLNSMMENGSYSDLHSIHPPLTYPAWASFMTGSNPDKHRILDFRRYEPSKLNDRLVNRKDIAVPSMWKILNDNGKSVCVINLPLTYPPENLEGSCIISGFDTPSTQSHFCYPEELRNDLLNKFPDYDFILGYGDDAYESIDKLKEFSMAVRKAFQMRTDVALYLMKHYPSWDVFMVQFQMVDTLQHKIWKYLDTESAGTEQQDIVLSCYKELDNQIKRLMSQEKNTITLAISDHGFGSMEGIVYPNTLLQKWGYLCVNTKNQPKQGPSILHKGLQIIPPSIRQLMNEVKHKVVQSDRGGQGHMDIVRENILAKKLGIEWSETKAFIAMADIYAFLYLNLAGREPEGTVSPGVEANLLIDELVNRFKLIRDSDGKLVFADVVPGCTLYPNWTEADLPDIVLIPRAGLATKRTCHETSIKLFPKPYLNGTHRPEGVIIVDGPGVAKSRDFSASLVDIAPTVLAICGVSIPSHMDGTILEEIFKFTPVSTYVDSYKSDENSDDDRTSLTIKEMKRINKRIKELNSLKGRI